MSERQQRRRMQRRRASTRVGIVGGGALALALVPAAAAQAQEPVAGKHYEVTNRSPQNVPGSLAYEISQANANPAASTAPNIITFASGITGSINLKQGLPEVDYSLDIKGPGARQLTLNGSGMPSDPFLGTGLIARKGASARKSIEGPGEANSVLEMGVDSKDPSALALTVSGLSIDNVPAGTPSGGAIYTDDVALTLSNDSFINDRSIDVGGAVADNDGALTVSGSTFAYDTTGYPGGAIYAGEGTITKIEDSTLAGNSAGLFGGAITATAATIIGSTITGNESGTYNGSGDTSDPHVGGGIFDDGSLTLEDSIVAGNTAYGTANDIALGSVSYTLSAKFSLIQDAAGLTTGLDASDITGKDPDLGPLQNNGGPTDTEVPFVDSPAINAGQAFSLKTDQRGLPRTVEFPGVSNASGGTGTDIGAVELQPYITSVGPKGNTAGHTVYIHGSGFDRTTAVLFGKVKAKKFKVLSDSEIAVTLPRQGKGRFAVTVVTPEGKSPRLGGGEYTYL
jgi:IPT/TIG domain-containing protein